jgi:hypothetical protein
MPGQAKSVSVTSLIFMVRLGPSGVGAPGAPRDTAGSGSARQRPQEILHRPGPARRRVRYNDLVGARERRGGGGVDEVSWNASGHGRVGRTGRILALVASGALIGLAVLLQASWRLTPPVSRLVARATSRGAEPDPVRAHAHALPHATTSGSSPVLLTEVSAVNRDVILDDDLAPSDWIELYNQSAAPVPLVGWRLVERGRPRRGWLFPEITLGPGSHLTVWASGKDRVGSAAGRRVNTRLSRAARRYHVANDVHTPLPGGSWTMRQARRVRVDIPVTEPGRYTLWMKARAADLSGTVRVRPEGSRSTIVTLAGGRPRHVMVGADGSVRVERAGMHSVNVAARIGTVDVIHLALVRAGSDDRGVDDRYARHLHADFRLGRGREGVMLVDPTGAVRDEAPAVDHAPTLTLQREPGALAWRVGPPTPHGRTFRPAPDLARYPSLSPGPLRVGPDRPPGVEELRYTVDASVPTAVAPRLEGPLELTRPTALRLRGFAGGAPVTAIVTRQFWIGPPPAAPTLMVALDPNLLTDPEIGIIPNDRWRRQQDLPDDSALGPLRLTRRRVWARERRQWLKPAHLLALDGEGLVFDGRARVRRFTMAVGPGAGLHVRTRDPVRPGRDVFGRMLAEPGRSVIVDEDDLNVPAYDAVRAAGGIAPLTRWGLVAVNGTPPDWRVLIEPLDDDFLRSRWGHARFDVLKGKNFAVKRGTTQAYDALADRLGRGAFTAADLAPLIDLPHLTALHFAALFLATGEHGEVWQTNFVADLDQAPPRIHAIGWDLDHAIQEGPAHDTFAQQRARVHGRRWNRGAFLAIELMMRLLDGDPVFRESYLRHAERTMNHVLTPSWWEARRRGAGGPADPDRAERVAHFFRERPAFLGLSLARGFGLPPPRVVRVGVEGPGDVTIDGYPYAGSYTGRYFTSGAIEVVVPPERRATFRHFTVNGRPMPGPVLAIPVTEDLEVVARFGS